MLTTLLIVYTTCLVALVYVHLGYPLLLVTLHFAARSIRGGRHQTTFATNDGAADSDDWPTITMIIPAHNEEAVIRQKLENTLAIDYPTERFRVIVGSDGSADRTAEIVREFLCNTARDRLQFFDFQQRRGKASVLNDCTTAADSDLICMTDANVMVHGDALRIMARRLADPRIGAVTGDVRLASHQANFGHGESAYMSLERIIQTAESSIGSIMGVDGGLYLIRRQLFTPLPPDTILDDFATTMNVVRSGHRVVYEARAVADENGTPLARQEYHRRVRVSAGAVQSMLRRQFPRFSTPIALWQYLSHKAVRWFSPMWLAGLLLSNLGLVLILGTSGATTDLRPLAMPLKVSLAGQFLFYAVALAAGVSVWFRRQRFGGVPFYFVLSHAAMVVGTVKGALHLQRVTWRQADRVLTPSPDN